ncbi:sorbosone dehydrogenase, partial [Sinorhizobium medicae]
MLANFITPDARDPRLAIKSRYRMLVDGKSVDAVSGRTIDRVSPGHLGVVVGTWPESSPEDVRLAIAAARRAFDTGPWPRMSGAERSRLMFKVADLILARQEELALI